MLYYSILIGNGQAKITYAGESADLEAKSDVPLLYSYAVSDPIKNVWLIYSAKTRVWKPPSQKSFL